MGMISLPMVTLAVVEFMVPRLKLPRSSRPKASENMSTDQSCRHSVNCPLYKFVNNVVAKEVSGANDLRYDSEVVEPGENLQRVINSWLSPLGVALTADGEVSEPPETITAKSLLDRHGIKTDRTDIPRAVLDIETFNSNYFQ